MARQKRIKSEVMSSMDIKRGLTRIAHEILEKTMAVKTWFSLEFAPVVFFWRNGLLQLLKSLKAQK